MNKRCAESLTDGTSLHDWPVTNLATGHVAGLCWFCGSSAEAFYERVIEQRRKEGRAYPHSMASKDEDGANGGNRRQEP